jgi:hypothetical protein
MDSVIVSRNAQKAWDWVVSCAKAPSRTISFDIRCSTRLDIFC